MAGRSVVLLCVHMPVCSFGTAVRTHGRLQCWYYCAYTWLAAVLVLLCVHMAGYSVGTTVRTRGLLQCVCTRPRSVPPPVTTLYAV